ncbi:MAG TPA: hypothetical protein VN083_11705 [Vicinamibacteria bacterium]|jgi:hypothetical protein|nr:hypothetical protein [Vicinamibacteria bacterium]
MRSPRAALLPIALLRSPILVRGSDLPDGFSPTIGGGTIVFAAEGGLPKIPDTGGVARRLTAHEGDERFPKISPDGLIHGKDAQLDNAIQEPAERIARDPKGLPKARPIPPGPRVPVE